MRLRGAPLKKGVRKRSAELRAWESPVRGAGGRQTGPGLRSDRRKYFLGMRPEIAESH